MKLRWMFSFISLVVVAFLIAGQIVDLIQSHSDVSTGWVNRRYSLAMQAFPAIQGNTVLFLGSSEVESGINPNLFNELLANEQIQVTGYNFGFRNMSPRNLGDLIRQMNFSRNPELKVDAIYIKFAPTDLTMTTKTATDAVNEEVAANIYSNAYLSRSFTASNLKNLAVKNLQGGLTNLNLNESVRYIALQTIGHVIDHPFKSWDELDAPRYHLWIDRKYNAAPEWNPARNGFHDRSADLSDQSSKNELKRIYEQQQEPQYLKFNFQVQEQRSDAISLRISPSLVQEFRSQLDQLRTLTNRVVLFYYPDHPDLPRTPEAKKRAESVINDLCTDRRLRCLRFDLDGTFNAHDYYDTLHLAPEAVDKLTRRLADDFKTLRRSN